MTTTTSTLTNFSETGATVTQNGTKTINLCAAQQQNAETILYDDNNRPYKMGWAPGERIYQDAYSAH